MSILGWAAYLACSWTWCIGMFLPVLLVRDYGIWGFVVFAVPNVVGAGAMGWVLRDGASERIVAAHAAAARWFSIVTVMFHAFFFPWLILSTTSSPGDSSELGASRFAIAALAILVFTLLAVSRFRAAAAVTWLLSATCAAVLLRPDAGLASFPIRASSTSAALSFDIAFLAPVCTFGFLLCPYLDLTFHRAAQQSPRNARRAAFTLGFGVLFLAMIMITLAYAGAMIDAIAATNPDWFPFRLLFFALLAHVGVQTIYTVVVHHTEYRRTGPPARVGLWAALLAFTCATLSPVFGFTYLERGGTPLSYHGMQSSEVIYRLFMSFYGLIFPAYVWLCMIPVRGETHTRRPSRQKLAVLAVACVLAAPCYWMGFIERETVWLAPGLGVVLVARVFIKASRVEAVSPATGGGGVTSAAK